MGKECYNYQCFKDAVWAVKNDDPYTEYHSCERHLVDLLDVGLVNTVWYVGDEKNEQEGTEE